MLCASPAVPPDPARADLNQVCRLPELPADAIGLPPVPSPVRPGLAAYLEGCLSTRRRRVFRVLPCRAAGCCRPGIPQPDGGPALSGAAGSDSELTGQLLAPAWWLLWAWSRVPLPDPPSTCPSRPLPVIFGRECERCPGCGPGRIRDCPVGLSRRARGGR